MRLRNPFRERPQTPFDKPGVVVLDERRPAVIAKEEPSCHPDDMCMSQRYLECFEPSLLQRIRSGFGKWWARWGQLCTTPLFVLGVSALTFCMVAVEQGLEKARLANAKMELEEIRRQQAIQQELLRVETRYIIETMREVQIQLDRQRKQSEADRMRLQPQEKPQR